MIKKFEDRFSDDYFEATQSRNDIRRKDIDTYAMEFLKECLPERLKSHETELGFNECREQILNNANNKQNK